MARDFIYLASASPRRSELLGQIGVRFEVVPAGVSEAGLAEESATDYVLRVATAKADAVWDAVSAAGRPRPVLAADTAVVLDGRIFGKPEDETQAMQMLARLSGRTHEVETAVVLRCGDDLQARCTRSEVRFRATTAAERGAYCRTREPIDKAGAYGIQGLGAVFIDRVSGSYSGVMGLPLFETAELLAGCGLPVWLHADQTKR